MALKVKLSITVSDPDAGWSENETHTMLLLNASRAQIRKAAKSAVKELRDTGTLFEADGDG